MTGDRDAAGSGSGPSRPDGAPAPASLAGLAERVRAALLERALAAHDDARLQGLCMEGAWEAAVSAMRALDVAALARDASGEGGEGGGAPAPEQPATARKP